MGTPSFFHSQEYPCSTALKTNGHHAVDGIRFTAVPYRSHPEQLRTPIFPMTFAPVTLSLYKDALLDQPASYPSCSTLPSAFGTAKKQDQP
jgi:hypothetical protein